MSRAKLCRKECSSYWKVLVENMKNFPFLFIALEYKPSLIRIDLWGDERTFPWQYDGQRYSRGSRLRG